MQNSEKLKKEAGRLKVLYVEDSLSLKSDVEDVLKLYFKDVFVASEYSEAEEVFIKNNIDLVVSDLNIIKIGTLALVKRIREINPLQKIILLSTQNNTKNLIESIELQIDGYLFKPVNTQKMLNLLCKITYDINLEKAELINKRSIEESIVCENNILLSQPFKSVIEKSIEGVFVEIMFKTQSTLPQTIENKILEQTMDELKIYLKDIQINNAMFFSCGSRSFTIFIEKGSIEHISKDIQSFLNFSNIKMVQYKERSFNIDFMLGVTSGYDKSLITNIGMLHEKLKDDKIQMLVI